MNSLDIASIATLAAQGLVVRVLPDGSVEVRAAEAAAAAPRSAGARRTAAYRQRKALKAQTQDPKEGMPDEPSPSVTGREEASQDVTKRHDASQRVTVPDAAAEVPPSLRSPSLPLSSQTLLSPTHPLTSHPLGAKAEAAGAGAEAGTAAGAAAKAGSKAEAPARAFALACGAGGAPVPQDGAAAGPGPAGQAEIDAELMAEAKAAAEGGGQGDDDATPKSQQDGSLLGDEDDSPDPKGDAKGTRGLRQGRRKRKAGRKAEVGWREWNRTQAAVANAVALPLLAPAEFHAAWQRWQGYRTRRAAEARISSEAIGWTADAAEAGLRDCERAAEAHGWPAVVARIDQAIAGGWQGINTDKLALYAPRLGGGSSAAAASSFSPRSNTSSHSNTPSHFHANYRSSSPQRSDCANRPGRYASAPPAGAGVAVAV